MAVLPTGNVLLSGPNNGDVAILSTTDWFWRTLQPFQFVGDVTQPDQQSPGRVGGNSVLLPGTPSHPSSTVMEIGGYGPVTVPPNPPQVDVLGTATTAFLDASVSQPVWQAGPSMSVGRDYQNSVLLPDGKLVTIGGGHGVTSDANKTTATDPGMKYWTNNDARLKTVEIYDPATNSWTTGPSQHSYRAYHSSAMLLPNGDVLSAGDDAEEYLYDSQLHTPTNDPSFQGQAEIYKPWYDQGQPRITQYSVQSASPPRQVASTSQSFPVIHPGETFQIPFTPATNGQKLSKVLLMAPSAVTHADDMSQREVPLTIDCVTGNTATVTAPANLNVAPPGYYMLFLVDQHNVPSNATGHFVQFVPGSVGSGPQCTTSTTTTTPPPKPPKPPMPKAKLKYAKTKLAAVRSHCRLGVSVNLNMAATAGLTLSMSVFPKGKHPKPRRFKRASSASLRFAGAGSRNASLKLSRAACRALHTAAYAEFVIRLKLVAPSISAASGPFAPAITAASGPFDLWLPPPRRRHHK
jgi:hypothetical protein